MEPDDHTQDDDEAQNDDPLDGFQFESTPPPDAPPPQLDPLQMALVEGEKAYNAHLADSFVHEHMSPKTWCPLTLRLRF